MKVGKMSAKPISILVLLIALIVAGCGSDESATMSTTAGTSAGSGATTTNGETSSGALAPPGLYEQPDGTVQALGVLTYRDLEGGFWAVVDTTLPEEADSAPIVAVIGPSADMQDSIDSYRGEFVSVIGTEKDVSAYQAGPFIEATSIEVVEEMKVE
jgi:hypothetical protein